MTNKEPHYTDQRVAALMYDWHDVRFADSEDSPLVYLTSDIFAYPSDCFSNNPIYQEDIIYVRSDSRGIFNPQDGDENIGGWTFSGRLGMWCCDGEATAFIGRKDIDKRQGKQFFMPESESKNDK